MTLERLLHQITSFAIKNKIINFSAAGMTLAELDMKKMKDYPILFTAPTGAHTARTNTTGYQLTIYYMDRLLRDGGNDINVLSTSVEALKNIINGIKTIEGVIAVSEEYDVINFADTQRLSDNVAGAYATIRIEVINDSNCYEE